MGAGVAGLCAALEIAKAGEHCLLVSTNQSERAQSNLAAGGINADFNNVTTHYEDTMKTGAYLANEESVKELTTHAPEMIHFLQDLGVPFQMDGTQLASRKMGGHSVSRTVFAGSITGKAIMSALIDEVRRYEAKGLIERLPHHCF
ncbi:L-aspartate oxidase [Lachnospiraceae bacterium TWA4]|nr:L-aspartate oxidase [Lachnospiraceae bacterium TWA4]